MTRHHVEEAIGGAHMHDEGRSRSIDQAPAGDPAHAKKNDGGKLPIFRGFYLYFPRAIKVVAAVSLFGFQKYGEWGAWRNVPDAKPRYTDALMRHLIAYATGEKIDPDSNLPHLALAAWNAMAILELDL